VHPCIGPLAVRQNLGGDPGPKRVKRRAVIPEHALLIVEERLREQQAEGVRMPEGMPLDELALRVLIAVETRQVPRLH
jgi:hypothetical protein